MLSTLWQRWTQPGHLRQQDVSASQVAAAIRHLLWPWRCPLCGQGALLPAHRVVCPACLRLINSELISTYCIGCGRQLAENSGQQRCGPCQAQPMDFESLAVAGRHKHALRQAIVHWKFHRGLGLEPLLVDLLEEALARQPWRGDFEFFVPVPQSWMRWIGRRFSWPVRDLAIALSSREGRPVRAVLRARYHQPQVGLTRAQRIDNARHVFHVPPRLDLSGKRICLVDDVITTGATLHHAATALRKAGAERVWAIAIAKTTGAS